MVQVYKEMFDSPPEYQPIHLAMLSAADVICAQVQTPEGKQNENKHDAHRQTANIYLHY
jgi:hypothetical protein